ncbi:MAG TPA: MgtC/SapB family protein [Anaeromyxobacteraceae bacterium]|nr:MgtC/SapB family protein [Anaeromyxobacteraceae bacterium]
MDPYEPLLSLGLAVVAGLLIGLEREQSGPSDKDPESFLGGARTYPLVALAGALSALLGRHFGAPILVAVLGALVVFLVVSYVDVVRRGSDRGITSEVALVVAFLLGAVAVSSDLVPQGGRRVFTVLGTAVAVTALLSAKPVLQPLMRRVSREDVVSVLKFLIVAVLLVPWLPDRNFGPLGALNLRTIGWMMLLVAGVSFVGYAATRLLGPQRGLAVTGFVGGLVSSTAVTLAMSSRSKQNPAIERPAALAVVLASSLVFVRVLLVVAFVDQPLAAALAVPMLAMAAAGLSACAFLYRRAAKSNGGEPIHLKNPVSLSSAFEFALIFAAVMAGSKAASHYLGSAGVYAAALVAGTADMDAIALSMAELAGNQVTVAVGATAVVLAGFTNTVVKGGMAVALGSWGYARTVLACFAVILAAGGLSLLTVWR